MFGLLFVGASYPIPAASLQQVDATHWVLDVCATVRPDYAALRDVALFLTAPIDPSLALGLYVRAGGPDGAWLYRGCVHNGRPSDVVPLAWPLDGADNGADGGGGGVVMGGGFAGGGAASGGAQVGISVEPAAELAAREGARLGDKLDYARRVGLDLVHFMQSFPTQSVPGGARSYDRRGCCLLGACVCVY
jgi:hypothetical protein